MDQVTRLFGLIGFPLVHSGSPALFREKFIREGITDADYHLFPLADVNEFPELLKTNPRLLGLNVTIPYKQKIIPFLDNLDDTARTVGAVNTIKITRAEGTVKTKGYNTDVAGFQQTLKGIIPHAPALILGTGGAARAVAHALETNNIPYIFVSRTTRGSGIISYNDLTPLVLSEYLMIINATPAGMFPNINEAPSIPYQFLTGKHLLYDLVYNPGETEFLKRGKAMNAMTMNGKQMLVNQAEISFKIFMGNDKLFNISI